MQSGDNIIKGNAIVNQVAAVAALIALILGSVLYVTFGLKPVMYASIICFFITALFECFIKLEYKRSDMHKGILHTVKYDFYISIRFICKEQPNILKVLLLATLVNFFVIGTVMVGLPYIVRTILGLNAGYYGAAESMLGVAAIIGSIAAGLLTGKLKMDILPIILAILGAFLVPAGIIFLLPTDTIIRYIINIIAFCGMQMTACIFSIFALSYIQQRTPNSLIGKVMSYISTITMCAQPIGQTLYGLLFDSFTDSVYLVLIPTGIIVCVIGLSARGLFRKLDR
ncbi:MFS transporter [Anaerotignum propionicum]|uniref:MFS transporter n=1 Tax=Anaerotignum propionicum TaxID=28446 RepID=UPI00289E2734|nr:MFS transporter [Anaerotignum propionicum]